MKIKKYGTEQIIFSNDPGWNPLGAEMDGWIGSKIVPADGKTIWSYHFVIMLCLVPLSY